MTRCTPAEFEQKRILAQFYWEHTKKPVGEICRLSGIANAWIIRGWAHQLGWKFLGEKFARDRAGNLVKLPSVAPDADMQDIVEVGSRPNQKLNEALGRWNRANAAALKSLAEGQ